MERIRVDEDIRPLSEFRAEVATFIKQIQETGRPMVLTQHGRGVAVLVGAGEYERMQARLEMLEDIWQAEQQLNKGDGVPHDQARALVLEQIPK